MSKNVFIKFAEKLFSSVPGRLQQPTYLKKAETFITNNPEPFKAAGVINVVINQGDHISQSYEHKSHSSFVAYNDAEELAVAGHIDAVDPRKGEVYKPTDPDFIKRWETLSKANPGAGGQLEGSVKI